MEEEKKEVIEEEKVEEKKEEKVEVKEEKKEKKGNALPIIILSAIAVILLVIICILMLRNDGGVISHKTGKDKKDYHSEYTITGNDLQNFDLYFLQLEREKAGNKVYSPLSIKYALEMLAEGTRGESRHQLDAVIGEYKVRKYPNNEHMSFANAMFIRNSFKENVLPDYVDQINKKYGAEIVYDEFANPNAMNDWISTKTFRLINNLIDQDTVDQHDFFLINALAIDMNWVNLIQCAPTNTKLPCKHYSVSYNHENYYAGVSEIPSENDYPAMTFNGKDNIKSVQVGASFNNYDIVKELGEENIRKTVGEKYNEFLATGGCGDDPDTETFLNQYIEEIGENYHREDASSDFYLYVDDDVKMFAKNLREYDGTTLQYVGIMPKQQELKDFVKDINAEKLTNYISKLKTLKASNFKDGVVTKIFGNIPLFNYDYTLDLENDLKELGIKDIFDINQADLTGMLTKDTKRFITAAHKANIEFSNEGIKAAAVTMLGGAGAAGCWFDYKYDVPVEEIDLTFDKPYMYLIRNLKTGEVWFVGSVYEPTTK